jgi:hypothetical protein
MEMLSLSSMRGGLAAAMPGTMIFLEVMPPTGILSISHGNSRARAVLGAVPTSW